MASPPGVTISNLSGKYAMNKSISDDVDALLALQGIGWLTRKAIRLANVVLTIDEYEEDNVMHVDITSVASGLSTTQENRTLNWKESEHSDRIFGKVVGKSRLFKIQDFSMQGPGPAEDKTFLKAEKLKDLKTPSSFLEDEHLQSWAVSQGGGWTAEQIWGFEQIDGKRFYTRRVVVRKGQDVQRVRLVYDYQGPAPDKASEKDQDADLAYGN